MGYDGANHIGDVVNQTQVLGLEHHLIETFGPRDQGLAQAMPEGKDAPSVHDAPLAPAHTASGAVAAAEHILTWDQSAEKLVARIPFFVRKKARANIEKYAREKSIAVIDERTVLAAREHVGG